MLGQPLVNPPFIPVVLNQKGIESTMPFDTNHPLLNVILQWALILCVISVIGTFVGGVSSLMGGGKRGLSEFFGVIGRALSDLILVSPQRIFALATLTTRESVRRKALWIGAVFLVLFMFAGWFIGDSDDTTPAKAYISFVITTIRWMLLPLAVLLSCWGLPADIKDRSLHTVVTKPVRRSEVVLGRIAGYSFVITAILLVVSVVGYGWILRVVPERSQRQLISRVPRFGGMKMLDQNGDLFTGVNVGDMLDLRRFIAGGTKELAMWQFQGLKESDFPNDQDLRLEYAFEAFRSYKGDIATQIEFSIDLVNPETNQRVRLGVQPVNEFSSEIAHDLKENQTENLILIPRTISYLDGETTKTADLFKDLVANGNLNVEIKCLDAGQYLGVSPGDLFVRMPDRSFAVGYWKTIFTTWLMLVLIITIGTTASCILKGPVATLTTFGLLILGVFLKNGLIMRLGKYYSDGGEVVGGGSVEAFYRLVTGLNESTPLDESITKTVIETLDSGVYAMLYLAQYVIPDISIFDASTYLANGFDVPLASCVLPSLLITLGFFIPAYIIGYFGLQIRELEAK
ncbi:MAG: hypothetical protein DWH81_07930 [Planctomycetota bacterium]|nr:MAG: hypothetical protein DWH81_07930 [Planctomycetota bacterium]